VKILNKVKRSNGVRFGLCLFVSLLWSRAARAEVELVEKDGWTFTFDGRVNAFMSGGFGDAFPFPTPEPTPRDPNGLPVHPPFTATHSVMGGNSNGPGNGRADVGWPGNYGQQDINNRYLAIRVRSGMYGNILGFGIARKIGEETTVRGYISIWSTVESLGYDKWAPINAEAREGYFTVTGPWGSAIVGRTIGWLGRMSYEIDSAYGHGYGVGLPCTDALGPACGHIGTGALFPGYTAGLAYSTPSLGGLKVNVGAYDPIVFSTNASDWSHAPYPRPEGSITFDQRFSESARLKIGIEGLYQPITRIDTDPMSGNLKRFSTAIYGGSGGARIEAGPLRIGLSGFGGKGLGLFYALQRSSATEDLINHDLRTFLGFYGQAAVVFGKLHIAGGFGMSLVNQTKADKIDPTLSVIHYQRGASGALYYHLSDSLVLGLDYFLFMAGWYGAPVVDMSTMPATAVGKLAGEKQILNFVNAGVTYHW
jgi:hypothetical protein